MASSAKGRKRSNDDAENGSAAKKYTKDEISGKIRSGEMEIAAVTNKTAAVWSKFGSPRITGTDTIISGFAVCKCCKIVYKYDSKTGSTPLNQHKCKPIEKQKGSTAFSERTRRRLQKNSQTPTNSNSTGAQSYAVPMICDRCECLREMVCCSSARLS